MNRIEAAAQALDAFAGTKTSRRPSEQSAALNRACAIVNDHSSSPDDALKARAYMLQLGRGELSHEPVRRALAELMAGA